MALKFYDSKYMTAIANAIRSKNGSTDTYLVSEMADAIGGISVGDATSLVDGSIRNLRSDATSVRYYFMYNFSGIRTVELPFAKTIGERAFGGCSNLVSVVLGAVTRIDGRAFSYASNLAELVLNVEEIPTLASVSAFENTPIAAGSGNIYITDALVEQLKTTSPWNTYAAQIKPISERGA